MEEKNSISQHQKRDYKKGKSVEEDFASYFKDYQLSTQLQDRYEHWDVQIDDKKIDVKGLKKRKRGDAAVDENIHWVELKNVRGELGWLYGKADLFAFELKNSYVIVDKIDLQNLIAEKCKDKVICVSPEIYKLYTRNGRLDVITLIPSLDLCQISIQIIRKI